MQLLSYPIVPKALLERDASAMLCEYSGVATKRHLAAAASDSRGAFEPCVELPFEVEVVSTSAAASPELGGALSLVAVKGAPADLDVCAALAWAGAPLLGDTAWAAATAAGTEGSEGSEGASKLASRVPGGLHLALVGLTLPPSLAALRGPGALERATIDVPKKFAKVGTLYYCRS